MALSDFMQKANDWMTPQRALAFQAIGQGLSQMSVGQPANLSPAYSALMDRQRSAQMQQALKASGVLERFTPEQRAILAQMEPGAAQKIIAQTLFSPEPEPKRYNVGGALVDANGNVIYTTPEEEVVPEFRIEEMADGRKYYVDPTGRTPSRLVNPDLVVPEPEPEGWRTLSREEVAQAGLDPGQVWQEGLGGANAGQYRAADGSLVSVDVGGEQETEYDKVRGKAMGEYANEVQTAGRTAQRTLTALDAMERSMGSEGFYSGFGAQGVAQAKKVARALGWDVEGIEDMETFNALSKQAALDVMGGSLGTGFSNADRDFVLDQVPGLQNTPEGNALLVEVQRAIAKRTREIAKMARDYERENNRLDIGFEEMIAEYGEQNPLFTDEWWMDTKAKLQPQDMGDVPDSFTSDPNVTSTLRNNPELTAQDIWDALSEDQKRRFSE